jgi:hypothetical protein
MKAITLLFFFVETFYLRSPCIWDIVHHHLVRGSSHLVKFSTLQLNGTDHSINGPKTTVNGPIHPANSSDP